jgi:hypothetical protein
MSQAHRVAARFQTSAGRIKTASSRDLPEASAKFRQVLQRAVQNETTRKAKDALKEALDKFEEVIDLLKVAQHEADESIREASFDVDAAIEGMNLRGRDDFYTHLIKQEALIWLPAVMEGKEASIPGDIEFLEKRRGFNEAECRDFRRLANFFITRAEDIRKSTRRNYA